METTRQPRIVIEDLPAEQPLTEAEMTALLGAGRFRPTLEQLESRELMASGLTASLSGGLLQIQDSQAGDTIHVRQISGLVSVDGIAIQTSAGCQASIAVSALSAVDVYTPGGNDQVWLGDVGDALTLPVAMQDGLTGDTLYTPANVSGLTLGSDVTKALETPNGTAFALHANGSLSSTAGGQCLSNAGISSVTALVSDATGNVFALVPTTGVVNEHTLGTGTGWTPVGTSATSLVSDATGNVFALVPTTGVVNEHTLGTGTGSSWTELGTNGVVVAGTIWFLGTTSNADGHGNYAIYSFTGGKLTPMTGYYGVSIGVAEGTVWVLNAGNAVYYWNAGSSSFLPQTSVAGSGGIWFLGTTPNMDGHNNYAIYRFTGGQITPQVLGYATSLQNVGGVLYAMNQAGAAFRWNGSGFAAIPNLAGGSLQSIVSLSGSAAAFCAGGNLSIFNPTTGSVLVALSNVQGTPQGNGFAVQVGNYLSANVSVQYASGTATLNFTNVSLNAGAILSPLLAQVGQIAHGLSSVLSPLTQTLIAVPQQLGGGNLTTAVLLESLLNAEFDSDDVAKVQQLAALETTLQQISSTSLGSVSLGNFSVTTQVAGSLNFAPGSALPGVLTQFVQSLVPDGITLPALSDPTQFLALLSGNPIVTVATYTPQFQPINVGNISATLIDVPLPVPGLSVEGNLEGSISAQFGGTLSITASGTLSGTATLTLNCQVGVAAELALGYADLNLGGYAVFAGIDFTSQLTAGPDGVHVSPPTQTQPTIQANWVGPDFNLQGVINLISVEGQRLSDAISNDVSSGAQQVSNALSNAVAKESNVLANWAQQASNAVSNAGQQASNDLASIDPTNPNSIW